MNNIKWKGTTEKEREPLNQYNEEESQKKEKHIELKEETNQVKTKKELIKNISKKGRTFINRKRNRTLKRRKKRTFLRILLTSKRSQKNTYW